MLFQLVAGHYLDLFDPLAPRLDLVATNGLSIFLTGEVWWLIYSVVLSLALHKGLKFAELNKFLDPSLQADDFIFIRLDEVSIVDMTVVFI